MNFWRRLFRKPRQGQEELLQRYSADVAFREQLQQDFEGAISGYELSPEAVEFFRRWVREGSPVERAARAIIEKCGDGVLPR